MLLKLQLVSGNSEFRPALRVLLERQSDLLVVHNAATESETRAGGHRRPDVVLFETALSAAFDIGPTMKRERPRNRLMSLSRRPILDEVRSALSAACGFVSKMQSPRELVGAVRVVGAGASCLCRCVVPTQAAG